MRNLGLRAAFAQKTPWTCPTCLQRQASYDRAAKRFSTKARRLPPQTRKRIVLVTCATTGTLGAGTLVAVSDEVKHGYNAAERTGRVASTLVQCINE